MTRTRLRSFAMAGVVAASALGLTHPVLASGTDVPLDMPLDSGGFYFQFIENQGTGVGPGGSWALTGTQFHAETGDLTFALHVDLPPAAGFESGPIAVFWTLQASGAIPDYGDIETREVAPGESAAVEPVCDPTGRCTADFRLRMPTDEALAAVRALRNHHDERVALRLAFTVIRSLGGGAVLQVLPASEGRGPGGGTLGRPLDSAGGFFGYGFRPVDQPFIDTDRGVQGTNLVSLYGRAVQRAGLSPASSQRPVWRGARIDMDVAECYRSKLLVADTDGNTTLTLDLPETGHVSASGVVANGERWLVATDGLDGWHPVLSIAPEFDSLSVSGTFNCASRTGDLTAADGGLMTPHPPRFPALPPTDVLNAGMPSGGDWAWLIASLSLLVAALWLRRASSLQGPRYRQADASG